LRKTRTETAAITGRVSRRLMAGTSARRREGAATAMPAVEQMGQAWESMVEEFRSTQQCNCAARKMPAKRRARR